MKEPSPGLLCVSDLDGWASQWDQLVGHAPLPTPFLRSWWLTGTAGPRRRFVLVADEGRLLGGLALDETGGPGLRALHMMGSGSLCPDHMDLLAAPGEEDVTIGLLRDWFRRPGGRLLDLTGVVGRALVLAALPSPAQRLPFAVAPWTPLPDDSKAYFAGLPSQLRRNLRRASKRLSGEGAAYRANRGEGVATSLETLRRMHEAQWGRRSRFVSQFDRFAAAGRLGAEVDEVVVHELASDETVVATVVAFEVAGRVSLYQSARLTDARWSSAMSVLLGAVIADACDRGFREVDFLRGEEPYKEGFAPRRREMFRLLAARGATGHAARVASLAASTSRRRAEGVVRAARANLARIR